MRATILLFLIGAAAQAQNSAERTAPEPIYRVTVVSRTTKAINYGHRTEPTKIGFHGTVLLPNAQGQATVESKRGAMEIRAKFEHMDPPSRFGPEYLTYVLWAISPEGRPANLGEVVLNPSNKGKLAVSTDLQAFALLVTAEPYFSVTQPSDVVVMENVVRPDTVGKVQEVEAKYELLPRKQYVYDTVARSAVPSTPRVSMDEYEAMLALYEAQSALQIAKAAGAGEYAADTLQKAEQLYQQARSYQAQKAGSRKIVMTAREAAQASEDARAISAKRQQAQTLGSLQQ
jgi:hypothetical protein